MVEVLLHLFLTLALDGGQWLTLCPGRFSRWKILWCLLTRKLGGPKASLDVLDKRKISFPQRNSNIGPSSPHTSRLSYILQPCEQVHFSAFLSFHMFFSGVRLRAGPSGVRIPLGRKYFPYQQNVPTGCGTPPPSCSVGTVFLFREYSGRSLIF